MLKASEGPSQAEICNRNTESQAEIHQRPEISGLDQVIHISNAGESIGELCRHDGLARIHST